MTTILLINDANEVFADTDKSDTDALAVPAGVTAIPEDVVAMLGASKGVAGGLKKLGYTDTRPDAAT